MNNRRSGWAGVIRAALVAVFCLVATIRAEETPPASLAAVPPPLSADAVQLRSGDELERAQRPLATIIEQAEVPAFLKPAEEVRGDSDPPLSVQQMYVAGREAWLRGQRFEAIGHLQSALSVAPNSVELLQLLGLIYTEAGNRIRGAFYLERAVSLDPRDVDSLFLLGRFAVDQAQWERAIVTFERVLTLPPTERTDPAIALLARYYLAASLERAGFDAAAIEQYEKYLALPTELNRTTRFGRDLAVLSRQRGLAWQSVGDARARLGQLERALEAYLQAIKESDDAAGLNARVVHTFLQLKQVDQALQFAVSELQKNPGDAHAMALIEYVAPRADNSKKLAQSLQKIYENAGRPANMAVALARVLQTRQAVALLEAHLEQKPTDREVFAELVRRQLDQGSTASVVQMLESAVAIMERLPQGQDIYAAAALDAVTDQQQLLDATDQLIRKLPRDRHARLLRGMALIRANRLDEAAVELSKTIEGQEQAPQAAGLALAQLLTAQGEVEKAVEVLDKLPDQTDSQVLRLRVHILARTEKLPEALTLIDQLIEQHPADVELVVFKATLQRRGQLDPLAAERTLLDALNRMPEQERLYEELLSLYDHEQIPDALRQYERLMRRLLQTLPQSRVARLERAKLLSHSNPRVAEQLLRGLLTENEKDYPALRYLLELLVQTERRGEADQLLDQKLTRTPEDPVLLTVAMEFYRDKDVERYWGLLEKRILLEPPGFERSRNLAAIYLQAGRFDKAVEVAIEALGQQDQQEPAVMLHLLGRSYIGAGTPEKFDAQVEAAIKRFPDDEADLLYEWANFRDRTGRRAEAEKMMVALLQKHPKHGPTNNNLGYLWANEGRNLDQAKRMIEAAVELEPDNAAYLDSMGWVLYKQGDFENAVTWLKRARDAENGQYPVIMDHLGDALYRTGKQQEAAEVWLHAQRRLMELNDQESDPELKGLERLLPLKVESVRAKQPAPVADSPGLKAAE